MKLRYLYAVGLGGVAMLSGGEKVSEQQDFESLLKADWQVRLDDARTGDWHDHWMLDGVHATLRNDESGMHFQAGPEIGDYAHHAGLWTKQSFKGDVRIDYEYTRTDDTIRNVTILYVQAMGSGEGPHTKDIAEWNELRVVPAMKTYFNNMNTYHVSYAAFGTKNDVAEEDSIRSWRDMPRLKKGLTGTELKPDYSRTGLFAPGVPHQMTVIRRGRDLYMEIRNDEQAYLCHWNNDTLPEITEGRIGLRHMYSRGARYQNFRVAVLRE